MKNETTTVEDQNWEPACISKSDDKVGEKHEVDNGEFPITSLSTGIQIQSSNMVPIDLVVGK